jgi:hypothetical protein
MNVAEPLLDYLNKKLGRMPTPEEYVAANGVDAADIEGEMIELSPRRLRRGIERIATKARRETQ